MRDSGGRGGGWKGDALRRDGGRDEVERVEGGYEERYSDGWVGWRVFWALVVPREEGRVEDEVLEDEFQRFRVQESAEDRVPGREVCEDEAEAVEGMAVLVGRAFTWELLLVVLVLSRVGARNCRQAFAANG